MADAKIVCITGTRKGIGKGLASHYIRKGCTVIGCSRGPGTINHDRYHHYITDVANEESVISMVRDVRSKFRVIHVLINNAGLASMNHIMTTPWDKAHEIINVNFLGPFLLTREVAKIMIRQKSGSIVNFSTVAAPLSLEGEAIYAASKAAVEKFTIVSSKELAKHGIRVNAIGPTPIKTDLIKGIPKEKIKALLNAQSFQRLGKLDDITNVIDFFISEKSNFITGQTIYLGGISY